MTKSRLFCSCAASRTEPETLLPAAAPDFAAQLLDAKAEGAEQIRDKAMFELFYSSGLRLAELVSIDLNEGRLMLREAEATVTGKGLTPLP